MKKYIILFCIAHLFFACGNDFLDIDPSTAASESNLIKSVEDLAIATAGGYEVFTSGIYYGGEYPYIPELMAADFMEPAWGSHHMKFFYAYNLNKVQAETAFFRLIYQGLQNINIILKKSEALKQTDECKALVAELRVQRALLHFDLVRMYGPLYSNLGKGAIKSDAFGIRIAKEPIDNMRAPFYRDQVSDVYAFIQQELEAVVNDLPRERRKGYIDYWSAKAIMARLYLYMENYALALEMSKEIMANTDFRLYEREEYLSVWKETYTSESLFELAVLIDDNVGYGSLGWICSEKGYQSAAATADFLALKEADPEDIRFDLLQYSTKDKCWYPTAKYPGRDGNVKINNPKVIRLSEIYLIASEAALKLGDKPLAGTYLTELRKRRTLTDPEKYLTQITLDDILYERNLELFCEGHRAWDLWRNQRSVERYTSLEEKNEKGHTDNLENGVITFDYYKTIYPIAEREIELLPLEDQAKQQNPGY